jgi:hypothetical protein
MVKVLQYDKIERHSLLHYINLWKKNLAHTTDILAISG